MRRGMVIISLGWARPRLCASRSTGIGRPGRRTGTTPPDLYAHVATPKVGILRSVVVAETDDEAIAAARSAHRDWYHSITKLWHDHNDHSVDGLFAWTSLPGRDPTVWLTGTHARADRPAGGPEWLQLRDLLVRLGHPASREDTAFTAAVCRGGDAGVSGNALLST